MCVCVCVGKFIYACDEERQPLLGQLPHPLELPVTCRHISATFSSEDWCGIGARFKVSFAI